MSNVPVGSPEYGMTTVSRCRWGLSPASTHTKGEKMEGIYFYGNYTKTKDSVKSSIGFPEYRITNAKNVKWGLPPSATHTE